MVCKINSDLQFYNLLFTIDLQFDYLAICNLKKGGVAG